MTTDAAATAPEGALPIILTTEEVARAVKRTPRHIERAVAAGLLKRTGRARFRAADVAAWIDAGMPSGRATRQQ